MPRHSRRFHQHQFTADGSDLGILEVRGEFSDGPLVEGLPRVAEHDDLTLCLRNADIQCRCLSPALGQRNQPHPISGIPIDNVRRSIGGTVGDHDDFQSVGRKVQTENVFDSQADVGSFVAGSNDNGNRRSEWFLIHRPSPVLRP